MVDVAGKPVTERSASAAGQVRMSRAAFELLEQGKAAKGDVLTVAEVAGMDLSYAPPFSPVWDPVLLAAGKAAALV